MEVMVQILWASLLDLLVIIKTMVNIMERGVFRVCGVLNQLMICLPQKWDLIVTEMALSSILGSDTRVLRILFVV